MIGTVIQKVIGLINEELYRIDSNGIQPDSKCVVIGNVSQLESNSDDISSGLENKIIASIVNVEQDSPLRNGSHYSKISDNAIKYHNPAIYLNLYILFSANVKFDDIKGHFDSLNDLTEIIAFFQKKNVFKSQDLEGLEDLVDLQFDKLIFDQYSMSFEQLNHLWGILGGKYLPSVLYKVRLVTVFVDEGNEGSVVESIERKESVIN